MELEEVSEPVATPAERRIFMLRNLVEIVAIAARGTIAVAVRRGPLRGPVAALRDRPADCTPAIDTDHCPGTTTTTVTYLPL